MKSSTHSLRAVVVALILGTLWTSASAFRPVVAPSPVISRRRGQYHPQHVAALLKAEKDDNFNEVSGDDEMMELMRSLKSRTDSILQNERQREINLRKASCTSGVELVLPDWVRRLDVDYPLVACGSASSDIYIAHLETGQILATTRTTTTRGGSNDNDNDDDKHVAAAAADERLSTIAHERIEHTMHQLYGQFDGGGTLAVALKGTLLVEARRSGGVHVWRLNPTSNNNNNNDNDGDNTVKLVSQGFMPALQDCLVTALHISDDGYLWVTTDEGLVEAYSVDDDSSQMLPLTLRLQPDLLWKLDRENNSTTTSSSSSSSCAVVVLSLDVNPELGCAVVTTDTGSVFLLSLEDDDNDEQQKKLVRKPIGSFVVPPFDGTEQRRSSNNVFPTSATIVTASSSSSSLGHTSEYGKNIQVNCPKCFYIACGTNDGSLYLQSLKTNEEGDGIDTERPFAAAAGQHQRSIRQLMPQHFAAVKTMASPGPGLLITGGLDGTLRLWDVGGDLFAAAAENTAKFMYQFVGYKVWLGSLWTDGVRIVTDGTDNTVIVHRFGTPDASKKIRPQDKPEDRKEGNDL